MEFKRNLMSGTSHVRSCPGVRDTYETVERNCAVCSRTFKLLHSRDQCTSTQHGRPLCRAWVTGIASPWRMERLRSASAPAVGLVLSVMMAARMTPSVRGGAGGGGLASSPPPPCSMQAVKAGGHTGRHVAPCGHEQSSYRKQARCSSLHMRRLSCQEVTG